ncbi:RHS repeat-associated core domain-containing protein, partial [Streptomyces sp. NPDC059985]|uniref:RHS repeat-associated core domain-containing protein n=1 Tax=Streptomyces sp. NPDC059985 TaxID=3347025 RepID=UPI003686F8B0
WAEGAKPEDYQGPDNTVTVVDNTIEGGKRTVATTLAQGSDAETKTVQVLDLATGQAIETTDAAGIKSTVAYDVLGRPLTQTAFAGIEGKELVTRITYDSPTRTTVETPDGKRTITETDALGRQKSVADNVVDGKAEGPDGARTLSKTTYTWANNNLVTTVTDTSGRITTTTAGAAGTQTVTTNPDGTHQQSLSDIVANTSTSGIIPTTGTPGTWNDAPATATQSVDLANLTQTITGRNKDGTHASPTTQVSDALGRTKTATSGDVTTTPLYGPGGQSSGNILTPANPEQFPGNTVTAEGTASLSGAPMNKKLSEDGSERRAGRNKVYDAAGRVIRNTNPNGTVQAYQYNGKGQVEKATVSAKDGSVLSETVHTYDGVTGRPSTMVVSGGEKAAEQKSFAYHHQTGRATAVWNTDDEEGTKVSYGYDADGNVTSVTYPDGKQVSRTFDKSGRIGSVTDITDAVTHYLYNDGENEDGTLKDGRLIKAVQVKAGDQPDTTTPLTSASYQYDDLGRLFKTIQGNGHTTTRTFYDSGQVKSETTRTADQDNAPVVFDGDYAYDSHGNLTRQTQQQLKTGENGKPTAPGDDSLITTTTLHTYDAYDRLTSTTIHDGSDAKAPQAKKTEYTINVASDVTDIATTGSNPTTEHRTIDPAGRLTHITTNGEKQDQTWDDAGNLLKDTNGTTYTYNLFNKLTSTTSPDHVTSTYTYWADGTRKTTTTANQTTTYHYDPDGQLTNDTHEKDNHTPLTATYLTTPTGREARTLITPDHTPAPDQTGAGYYTTDRHTSIRALTTTNGTPTHTYTYDNYGTPTTPHGQHITHTPPTDRAHHNPYGYTNEYANPENGTQHHHSRTYNAPTGTYLQADPAPLFNTYNHHHTNPHKYTDPSGNTPGKLGALLKSLTGGNSTTQVDNAAKATVKQEKPQGVISSLLDSSGLNKLDGTVKEVENPGTFKSPTQAAHFVYKNNNGRTHNCFSTMVCSDKLLRGPNAEDGNNKFFLPDNPPGVVEANLLNLHHHRVIFRADMAREHARLYETAGKEFSEYAVAGKLIERFGGEANVGAVYLLSVKRSYFDGHYLNSFVDSDGIMRVVDGQSGYANTLSRYSKEMEATDANYSVLRTGTLRKFYFEAVDSEAWGRHLKVPDAKVIIRGDAAN